MAIIRKNNQTNYFNSESEYYEYLYLNIDPCQNYTTTTTTIATTTLCVCRGRRCRNCMTTTTTTTTPIPIPFCNLTTTKYVTVINLNNTENSTLYSNSNKLISIFSILELVLVNLMFN